MKKLGVSILILSLFLVTGCNRKGKPSKGTSSVKKGVIFVKDSYAKSLSKAKELNKPIFIDFYTTWCMPCKLMDSEVFTQKPVSDFLNQNFINLKIDAERGEGPKLAKQFGVYGYPTFVYLDSNGKVIEQVTGSTTGTNLISMGQRTLQAN